MTTRLEYFENHVDKSTAGCWLWTGCTDRDGYGLFQMDHGITRAHRTSYEFFRGPIPDELTLDHLCRNRRCVNPDHLEPVTVRENTLRGEGITAHNARKTHCKRGHEFTPENTLVRQSPKYQRVCRICKRALERGRVR